ncbi:DnaJ domain-containing protein [Xylaria sp. FL1777]|nr:DnaJ domain-containing protein [Xylaria sp. FL1777]
MPDYYAVLEIQPTATQGEITTAFRRLAIVHHPDKNPDDIPGATQRFQNIQRAYETLSNDSERRRYDASRNTPSPSEDVHYGGQRTYWPASHADWFFDVLFGFGMYEPQRRREQNARSWHERQEQERREREREQKRREKEQELEQERCQEQRERAAREKMLKREARQAEQAATEALRAARFDQETKKQQALWELTVAVTEEERFLGCLHSEFCAKIQQRRKLKCDVCGVKRGTTTFECPHCAHHLCQLCVTEFTKERARAS